jgi:hypothetical protein
MKFTLLAFICSNVITALPAKLEETNPSLDAEASEYPTIVAFFEQYNKYKQMNSPEVGAVMLEDFLDQILSKVNKD